MSLSCCMCFVILMFEASHYTSFDPFLTAAGKYQLHSMASLVAVLGTCKYDV